MADTQAKGHDYHLVDPSPWPVFGAGSALMTALGLVWWLHEGPPWLFAVGILGVLYTMLVWWRDVINEATFDGHHTPIVQLHHRYGMLMFIASSEKPVYAVMIPASETATPEITASQPNHLG